MRSAQREGSALHRLFSLEILPQPFLHSRGVEEPSPAHKAIRWPRWRVTVMSDSPHGGLPAFRPLPCRCSLVRKDFFAANHLSEPPRSLPTTPSLTHPPAGSLGSSTNFLSSLTGGPAPERAPGFYAFFVFFVYPRRQPSATATAKKAPGDYKYASCS